MLHLINSFSNLRVMVIGEAILDNYLNGWTDRLCREAPVPVISVVERKHAPGGAANTALNVQNLGAEALFLSVIGKDADGSMLQEVLEDRGVCTDYLLFQPNRSTLAKNRLIAGSQMVVRFDQGSTESLDPQTEQALIDRLELLFPTCDAKRRRPPPCTRAI